MRPLFLLAGLMGLGCAKTPTVDEKLFISHIGNALVGGGMVRTTTTVYYAQDGKIKSKRWITEIEP